MKKLYFLLLFVTFFTFLVSQNDYSLTDFKIFIDAKAGYSIEYPTFWTCEDHTAKNSMIRADVAQGDIVGFQIRFYQKQGKDFDQFVNNYISSFIGDMKSHWKGSIQESKRENKTINGVSSCWVWIEAEKGNGERWLFKEYLYQIPDGIVALQSGVLQIYRNQYETMLDDVGLSFTKK